VYRPVTLPREQIRPAWRAAVLAYRRVRQAGYLDPPARDAAEAAFAEVLPEMPEGEVSKEVARAIAYAAREHVAWFWRGVGGRGV
jgi:hypothetical protein